MHTHFRPGDFLVYRKPKYSAHPGPNARDIHAAPHGDLYAYYVNKYWTVVAVRPDRHVVVRTRRGKEHTLAENDPALRPATWWERLWLRHRFPAPGPTP